MSALATNLDFFFTFQEDHLMEDGTEVVCVCVCVCVCMRVSQNVSHQHPSSRQNTDLHSLK